MSVSVHSSSIVSNKAQLGENVRIGPFCIVEDDVVVGDGSILHSHVVLGNGARLGKDVQVFPGATVSTAPQDLKYKDEPTTAFVGDRTVIRESATVNRGTTASNTTIVGSDCLIMAYAHVAHDCIVGNHVIMANSVNLSGHVEVQDWAIIGGVTGVHQFVRIGAHSMIAGCSRVVQDVPPYTLCGREPLVVEALNLVGLRRRGFTYDDIKAIDEFYDALYRGGLNTTQALEAYKGSHSEIIGHVQSAIDFVAASKRGICRSYAAQKK